MLSLVAAGALAAAAPALVFEERHARFPDAYQDAVVEHRYPFVNAGTKPVTIVETLAVGGDGHVAVTPRIVPPGGRGEVQVSQPLGTRLGRAAFRYAVITDEGLERYRVTLSGFVQSAYDPESLTVDFGAFDRGLGASAEFTLGSREIPRLELLAVEDAPEFLRLDATRRAGAAEEALAIHATIAPGAPRGVVHGAVTLRTNVPHQPRWILPFRGHVLGAVAPSENPLQLGVIEVGVRASKTVEFRHRTAGAVRFASVECVEGAANHESGACDPPRSDCRRVVLRVTPTVPGSVRGELRVQIEGEDGPIALRWFGVAVEPGTRVKQIDEPGDADAP